jgi:hypothetical protein
MAKPHRMALATALAVWCALIPGAWGGVWVVQVVLVVITLGSLLTAWLRLSRGAAALRAKP